MKQGCLETSDLFNCIIDHLMTGVRLGNYHLTCQEYADDSTLFSDTVSNLVAGLSIFQEEAS